jgi:TonB-linked SusC/RagA family outer membrane protein
MLVVFVPATLFAQNAVFKGKITDKQTGEPLPGVNILLLENARGTATDLDGNFSLDNLLTGTYTARVTYIGYLTITETVTITGNGLTKNFQLESDVSSLEEVVITGYTEQGRNQVTGAVTVVEPKNIELVPVASFDQILQGQSPGLYVTSGSGQPGSASTVLIRGQASINGGNAPLYIIDGIPISAGDFATLNPNDFQSISVLKDASSTAEYGSRGTNGVIVITTKKGRAGKTQINYQSQFGISTIGTPRFEMMNTQEKLAFEERVQIGPGWTNSPNNPSYASASPEERAARDARLAELRSINTDWTDVFFRDGTTMSHELNFSGGNEKTRYYVSTGIFGQEGISERSSLDRYTLRVNLDYQANDNLEVGVNLSTGYSESSFPPGAGVNLANPFAAAYLANPYERLYNDDGTVAVGPNLTGANAFDRLDKDLSANNEIKTVGRIYADYTMGDFQVGGSIGIDYNRTDGNTFTNPLSFAGQNVANGNAGALSKNTSLTARITSLVNARWQKTFNDVHDVSVFAANEFISTRQEGFNYTGYGINVKLPNTPAGITPGTPDNNQIPVVGGFITENALWSQFAILNYSYEQKYNLKVNIRRDGSSRFGSENQYAVLWAVGGSWIASEEDFMADYDFVNRLALRVSYGTTGNQAGIGNFQWRPTYGTLSYNGQQGLAPIGVGNPALQWETATKFNVGVDFEMFDNRVFGRVDYYNELTNDLFINQQLSRTAGFAALEINAGSMRNEGIELELGGDLVRTKSLTVSARVNVANNINTIEDLGQVSEFEQGTSIIREGLSIGSHFVVPWAGVDPVTGRPLYRDLDGNITDQYSDNFAQTGFGTSLPPWTGGGGIDIIYKNLSIRSQFNFASGYSRFNNQSFFQENHAFANFNLNTVMNTMWTQPGDITEVQSSNTERQFTSKDIEDASFIRFRNLLISYNIPGSVFDGLANIRGIRIFAQGQNLRTWTSFTGFDPEDSNNIAQYEYPLPRIYTFGLDINF